MRSRGISTLPSGRDCSRSQHRELDDRSAAFRRLGCEFELRLEAVRSYELANRMRRDLASRAAVAADDQPTAGRDDLSEQPVEVLALPRGRHVHELRPDEIEPKRRLPGQRVAD